MSRNLASTLARNDGTYKPSAGTHNERQDSPYAKDFGASTAVPGLRGRIASVAEPPEESAEISASSMKYAGNAGIRSPAFEVGRYTQG